MKSFDHTLHKLVLFDEGSVDMVIRNKKLFQAPNSLVSLGTSATNCFSYHVYVNNTMLVICSNTWKAQLSRTPMDDAQWIMANQVLVDVSSPLWKP